MSNYPFRPDRRGKPKSSHSGSRKGRTWLQRDGAPQGPRPKEAVLDSLLCRFGHTGAALSSFLHAHRLNHIPQHVWGKKGRA